MPSVTFILPDGRKKNYEASEGETLLNLAHRSDPDLLEGACEGSLACSTCHVIVDPEFYDTLEKCNPISDEENDMLDLAFGLTETSRLGCQIKLTNDINGICVTIPRVTRNISLDKQEKD
ncbi:ferredoxin family 2Fe-2S iron-sulfur cluster binding protein [Wolbachia endosymbiont of Chironomus riparius]|uniref:ferredoxin family 2Fe-2S iron-sulfur cluster binding protein n=1 Tax=Wolbachia endosymbiont of Chironomus riparius TaxID=2883238 RepID=UPI0020A1A4E5|nr:ferredoxin family 2Fe-2S iron-sulfur cluster binding protein [Wolbachia endosymbiont of Chironomus riparius]